MNSKSTESPSHYDHLEQMSTRELIENMNREDQTVPQVVAGAIPSIEPLIDRIAENMQQGGRLFYMGSGTSGRLGIVDASECPPTYGVPHGLVIGLIAGGEQAIHKAVEFAEDSLDQGWKDLQAHNIGPLDVVIGITASGTTPYVLGAMKVCRSHGIATGGITCNQNAPLSALVDFPIEVVVGPEFVTGSTRMKAGTAQKLVLNMISTSVMIKLGHVKGNKMIDMQLSNQKLWDRGARMIVEETGVAYPEAQRLLKEHGSVRAAVDAVKNAR